MKYIDKYAIVGRLGRGGMGVVYKALQPVTGRVVALKVCRPSDILLGVAGWDVVRDQFLREVRRMAAVRHPFVAQVLDAGTAAEGQLGGTEDAPACPGGAPYYVMEYYCNNLGVQLGEGYEAEAASRRMGVEDALRVAGQVGQALARLHWGGVVHRDVKPYNVMLTDEGEVRLIDFGLSRLRGERELGRVRGMVAGTPYYTAPEQEADADAADERSDVYSVGVMLYRMLTGRLPERGGRDLARHAPELPGEFAAVLTRALAEDPAARYGSALEFTAALDGLGRAWERAKNGVCAAPQEPSEQDGIFHESVQTMVRSAPVRVGLKAGREAFGLDDLWRPGVYASGAWESGPESDVEAVVLDRARGLCWQRGGSAYPLTFAEAEAYAAGLNEAGVSESGFGGRRGWRLPTVAELVTLLTPPGESGALCVEPVFDRAQRRLWSADRKAFTAAWYADADLGFVWWQDLTCSFHVRAVASLRPDERRS